MYSILNTKVTKASSGDIYIYIYLYSLEYIRGDVEKGWGDWEKRGGQKEATLQGWPRHEGGKEGRGSLEGFGGMRTEQKDLLTHKQPPRCKGFKEQLQCTRSARTTLKENK